MKEVEVYATRDQIETFQGSVLWADMIRELEAWKTGFEMEADSIVDDAAKENPSTASVLLHLGDINGRKKAVDYLMSLPDIFLQILEDKKNAIRREQAD